jgi:hypothetical protein
MRLWTVHPSYLDATGMVALWREALLAQKVLLGETRGYTRHPQLLRFRAHPDPLAMISAYLHGVLAEAALRGFRFDASKIAAPPCRGRVEESEGQLLFEWRHLLAKLKARAPLLHERYRRIGRPDPHPLFRIVPGGKREWEKGGN